MNVFFTLFNNIYFGDQYDDLPTGEAWRGNYEKAKQTLRETPPSPGELGTGPAPFLHSLPLSCGVCFCCCCGTFVVCLFETRSHYLPWWLRTNSHPLASLFLSSENQGMCHYAWQNCVFVCLLFRSFCGAQAGFLPQTTGCQLCSFVVPHLASRTVHPKCPYVINKVR